MAARSFLGAGDIFINRMVDGVKQGMIGPIKANKLEIQPQVDTKQSTSKGRYDYGQVLESVNLAQPTEFSLELKEVTGDILVMAFLGTSSDLTQPAGTLTDFAVTVTRKGPWLPLGVKNLEALVAVENVGGTVTYVEGVDYELNRPLGWIRVLPTSAIALDAVLHVTGGYEAATGVVIAGSTRTEVRAEIVFDGINQADGTQATVEIWEAVLSADSAFDFLADDFGNVSLTGNLKTPAGKASPYEVTIQDPVV
jgi:hypothetical protein